MMIQYAIAEPHPTKTKVITFFTNAYLILLQCLNVLTLAARQIGGDLVAPIPHPWALYYRREAAVEQGVVMPHSTLTFLINTLLALAQIKSQGQPGFPYETHPQLVRFSIACLLMYGLACAVDLIVSAVGIHRACVLAIMP